MRTTFGPLPSSLHRRRVWIDTLSFSAASSGRNRGVMVFPQCSYLSPLHWANVRLAGHYYTLRIEDFNPANLCVLAECLHRRGNPLVVGDHIRSEERRVAKEGRSRW